MNYQKTTEEIADVYIKRIIEQNKQQYSESYELGKKNMYNVLAHRDACIYRLQEIIRNHKSNISNQTLNNYTKLENSKTKYNEDWTWVSKIIYVLLEKNAPLRSIQMIEYFVPIDERIRTSHDMVGYFSAFLTKAVKNERVVKIKVKGFKGYFYALPEWLQNGKLRETYYRKMNLFVNQ
jgi:hypothetical protein